MAEKAWHKFLPPETEDVNVDNLKEFFRTMYERQEVWYKRNILKLPAPWTEDPILRDYKFTNVYRELDRSSQFLIENYICDTQIKDLTNLLWKMMIYRFYNKPMVFEESDHGILIPDWKTYDPKKMWDETVRVREDFCDPWHDAYLMNPTNLTKKKAGWIDGEHRGIFRDYVYTNLVFTEVHKIIPQLSTMYRLNEYPDQIVKLLTTLPAVAVFMATEFYLDMTYIKKYRPEFNQYKYTDNDFYNAGPGAISGLRMIFPSLPKTRKEEGIEWLRDLAEEQLAKFGDFKSVGWNHKTKKYERVPFNVGAHQIEMFLCEYQKYFKMRVGEGKQRQKFKPRKSGLYQL